MSGPTFGHAYPGSAAENYERYFVPSIGEPVAEDLVAAAAPRPGERVLDVACGTGVVARRAAGAVGEGGAVVGLDVSPGMIHVARSAPLGERIAWHAAPAESMPLPDAAFDVVLCQMGLEFMPDRTAALREMWRVLVPGGRLVVNLPGPIPPALEMLADALSRHAGPGSGGFVRTVFSLHSEEEIRHLLDDARFRDVTISVGEKRLHLPAPEDFLWQYVASTPLSAALAQADEATLDALEREVCTRWQPWVTGGKLVITLRMSTATARKAG